MSPVAIPPPRLTDAMRQQIAMVRLLLPSLERQVPANIFKTIQLLDAEFREWERASS